ncbi:hypothetical protein BIT28_06850 [Photobacterium proteolyticum]|uniref:AIR9-like A9 domain-containing protein n=1 Tax=Photobacterium proteolyticum TaxID=1903952 RepID=A0A1Q9GEV9_9GAMM|nr:hypothetical protein [Photobacterium proteolyticum]OLQ72896.1 hypothetical protein BIT28_06850 [Photobacterium proteolyticum]
MNYKHSTLALVIVTALAGCNVEDNKALDSKNNNTYAPVVKGDVTIPALHVGETVLGVYQYFDPNPQPRLEGDSQFVWYDAQGNVLGNSQELELTYDHYEQDVNFCVTPVAAEGSNKIGDQTCSDSRVVAQPVGERPVAENVVVDNTSPSTGDTLRGSYDYYHSEVGEGDSQLIWYAGDNIIDGEETETLILAPAVTEGKQIKFCVVPETDANPTVRGEETCSEPTSAVEASVGSAPTASNVLIDGNPFVGARLTGDYTYTDADNDKEGTSTYRWLRNDSEIANADETLYRATQDDTGAFLKFCVTPGSATGLPNQGEEACYVMESAIELVIETPPTATNVSYTSNTNLPEVGATLVGTYDYQQAEDAPEGETDSVAFWKVDNVNQTICSDPKACTYTVSNDDLGMMLEFCVEPATELGTPAGQEFCSPQIEPMGIKITGELEYSKQLIATVYGYTDDLNSNAHWKVDTSNQDGPSGDSNPVSQGNGTTYQITGNNARDYIGKSVTFCLEASAEHGEKCVKASDFENVTGGLYYNSSDSSLRAIEPTRELVFGVATYHRPLTEAEAALKSGVPSANATVEINGIAWALFTHDGNFVYDSCRNLSEDGSWYLPLGYMQDEGNYESNVYADNTPPTVATDSLKSLMNSFIDAPDLMMSPVNGWPVGSSDSSLGAKYTYATATKRTDKDKFYAVRFYGPSTGTANPTDHSFVSCVK